MFTPEAGLAVLVAAGAAIFVLGGAVKGTLGVGLPLVVVPMLSLLVAGPRAMGLLVAPVLLSNAWQAWESGKLSKVRRFIPLIVTQLVATLLTVKFSQGMSTDLFNTMLALVVISAVLLMAFRPRGEITPRHERWAGPLVGAIAGFMGGVSSLTGPILITYLVALRLGRDEFVGSISILYLISAAPMYGAMLWWGRFGWEEVGWSLLALVPMFIGLKLGTAVRHRLSEELFRRLLFGFLTLLSVLLLVK